MSAGVGLFICAVTLILEDEEAHTLIRNSSPP
jgi:hypothetical protein